MKKLTIIIINYHTRDLVGQCLESIYEKCRDCQRYKIIVVDNATYDGVGDLIAQKYPSVEFIQSDENLGFGRANNLALERVEGDYVLFLNPDTVMINDAVTQLASYLDANLETVAVGGNLYTADMKPAQSYSDLHSLRTEFYYFLPNFIKRRLRFFNNRHNFSNKPRAVGYISGADLMVRREFLEQHGGFDARFFMYFEDMEIGYRIHKLYGEHSSECCGGGGDDGCGIGCGGGGSKQVVMSVPEAEIMHLEGASNSCSESKFRMLLQTKYQYYRLTRGENYARAVFLLTQCGYLFYSLFSRKSNRMKKRLWYRINKEEFHLPYKTESQR